MMKVDMGIINPKDPGNHEKIWLRDRSQENTVMKNLAEG